jgi:hypothetical protein
MTDEQQIQKMCYPMLHTYPSQHESVRLEYTTDNKQTGPEEHADNNTSVHHIETTYGRFNVKALSELQSGHPIHLTYKDRADQAETVFTFNIYHTFLQFIVIFSQSTCLLPIISTWDITCNTP